MINKKTKTTVIILCGGKGERLRPLTKKIPKPLINIKDKPILYHLINYLKTQGLNNFIIAAGYKSEKIFDYFNKNFLKNNIKIIDSGNADIITRIKDCLKNTKDNVLLCYGDTLANIDFKKYFDFHFKHKGTTSVVSYQFRSKFGILDIKKNNLVSDFIEKPLLNHWLNIGYFYFENKALKNLKKYKSFEDFLKYLIEKNEMYSYKHNGIHITVNSITELEEAEKNIENFKTN